MTGKDTIFPSSHWQESGIQKSVALYIFLWEALSGLSLTNNLHTVSQPYVQLVPEASPVSSSEFGQALLGVTLDWF